MRKPRTTLSLEERRQNKNAYGRERYARLCDYERARQREAHAAHPWKSLLRMQRWRAMDPNRAKTAGRRSWYRWAYGVEPEVADALLAAQDFRCGICRTDHPGGNGKWQLDHDHKKKKGDEGFLRGWLCHKCNTGGGKFNDDPVLLRLAADWFSKS